MAPAGTTAAVLARRAADHRRGAGLVIGATLAWSSVGSLARALATDAWTTLFWRSIFVAISLLAYLAEREGGQVQRPFRRLGLAGVGMGVCFAGSMIAFINALQLTTVAAAMAWMFLGEHVGPIKVMALLSAPITLQCREFLA